MKIFQVILVLIICLSCASKGGWLPIKGNWHPVFEEKISEEYFEIYIDDEKIHYYLPTGLIPPKNYNVKNNILFIENSITEKFEKKGVVSINNDTLTIQDMGYEIVCLKIESNSQLSDLINGNVSDSKYQGKFEERMLKWHDVLVP